MKDVAIHIMKFGYHSSVQEPTCMLPVSSGVMQHVPGAPFGFCVA